MRVGAVPAGLSVDGDVSEWPWSDPARVMTLEQSPEGVKAGGTPSLAIAARDADKLYLAIRVPMGEGVTPNAVAGLLGLGDGAPPGARSVLGWSARTASR